MLSRREFFRAFSASLFAGAALTVAPGLSLAQGGAGQERFVLVLLRGAMDGLTAVPPYGDSAYGALRGPLALAGPDSTEGVRDLDGFFGLHPAMEFCHDCYGKKEMLAVHAVASPYRERSHFDAQKVLENGTGGVAEKTGWVNRLLPLLEKSRRGEADAVALSNTTPLVMRGAAPVTSWAPSPMPGARDGLLFKVAAMYAADPVLSERLHQAMGAEAMIAEAVTENVMGKEGRAKGRRGGARYERAVIKAAAGFLRQEQGPRIAVIETGGWDTHANQGAYKGILANRLARLDEGLALLRTELGDRWFSTVVAVVTEFGRTVAVNGTNGTDHGTASCALLLGGAVKGGRVIADWPGLQRQQLYEGRDLRPTASLPTLWTGVLSEHFHIDPQQVAREVFAGGGKKPMVGMVRSA